MKKFITLILFFTFTFVLTACSPDEFIVSFDSDGGTVIEDQVVLDGEVAESPTDPEKEGFEFNHWFQGLESMPYDFSTVITENLELKASWTQLEYVVSFTTTMGTETDSQDVNHGDMATEPSDPTDPTHNFVHWYLTDDSVPFDFSSEVTSDVTLNAKWMEKELFAVTFDSAGGSAVTPQDVMEGYLATLPETPEYFGYEFVRWFTVDNTVAFDFSTPITEAVSLTALWTDRTLYEVSFDSAGGSDVALQNIFEGYLAVEPTAPEYHGYDFVRWYTTDEAIAFDFANPITEDTVLTALWTMKPIYEVSFDSAGGSPVTLQNVIEDEMAVEPANPSYYGFEFEYWYSNDENTPYDFTTAVTADVVLTAKWTELTLYSVRFLSLGGSSVSSQDVPDGDLADEPSSPSKMWHLFDYWYVTDENVPFDFSAPITANVYLKAKWNVDQNSTIYEEVIAYGLLLDGVTNTIPTPTRGDVHSADLRFYSESDLISDAGIVLPLPDSQPLGTTGDWKVKFTLNGGFIYHTYQIPLAYQEDVVIADTRVVPFENLTTEYDVADSDVTLLFEEGGSVPYIKVNDFFDLVSGFIDPTIPMTFTTDVDSLEVFYQYYDEDENITYDLILTIDATENTITTNDPGFYWAYIYSTETNYGRHIEYVQDHPMESYLEGEDVVYDLDDYNLDIVMYEGEVVLPYYITNQLFAGSAYYNVYYNYDGLYGIYSLPSDGSKELTDIQSSTKNSTEIPSDLSIHTFNVLAFDLNNLYGLKDIMGVTDYYDLLYYLKDDLLVKDPEQFEIGLRNLLLKELDEPHTSYGYHSYFNKPGYEGPVTNDLAVYGNRFVTWYYDGLVDTDDAIGAKWGEASSGWNVANKPNYWWLDDSTVMLSLNGFVTSDIEESAVYDELITEDMMEVSDLSLILPSVTLGNKFFYYNNSTETTNTVEMLVKGANAGYVDTYEAALLALGFTHVTDTSTDPLKQDGYYTMSVTDAGVTTNYMVVVGYDAQYDLLYVGMTNQVTTSYSGTWNVYADVYSLIEADSAVYMEFMLQEIEEEQPLFTDIVLDLSWNTGGNVGALYRVLGFITNDPFQVTGIDGDTNGASTSYVNIGDIPDYSNKTWFLLTTPTSFSAANSMANIFKANDLGEVIGVQTGGGACSITPILLPNGTAFTMSSNNISAYRTGTGTAEDPYVYHDVEFGIAPDYAISIEDIYDEAVLLGIINT